MSDSQVVIKKARLSFPALFEPKDFNGDGKFKYMATLLIPKDDKATLAVINEAIKAAEASMPKKNGKVAAYKSPLRDGDDKEYEGYAGHWYIAAKSNEAPNIVQKVAGKLVPLTDKRELYPGAYVAASINFYTSKEYGGMHVGLNNILKVANGERLGDERISAEDAFADVEVVDEEPGEDWMK